MVFGRYGCHLCWVGGLVFQFPVGIRWCSDCIMRYLTRTTTSYFQFPVGIRWCSDVGKEHVLNRLDYTFNSLWELDDVRTKNDYRAWYLVANFQFPVGIRWCSDKNTSTPKRSLYLLHFQFPVGIRWCSDEAWKSLSQAEQYFQFPVGIRWCSDCGAGSP